METEKRNPVSSLLLSAGVAVVLLTPLAVYIVLRSQEAGPGLREDPATADTVAKVVPKKQVIPPVESDRPQPKPERQASSAIAASSRLTPAPQRPFPSPRDVPVGMDKYKLIASFGKPTMVTTEVTEGSASEIFHYLKPEAGIETVVFLRSGRVISATSTVY